MIALLFFQIANAEKSSDTLLKLLEYVKELGYPLVNNAAYDIYQGRQCYVDMVNYVNINYDGRIFRCTAKEYSPKNRLGYLNEDGDIVWTKKQMIQKVMETPTFENEMCLHCKNWLSMADCVLAIAGTT